ncbi:MAG TPA: molybdenum cofactor guanylyltransferase [Chloroflexota bacterium]|nr:molybdenum cofactor guanylyltransferase [Chloroflexota bacterium]
MEAPVAAILAGGASRRMGRDKALLRLPDGLPVCTAVVEAARTVASRVILLVDHEEHARALLRVLTPPLPQVLLDRAPGAGPLASLAGALGAVEAPALLLLAVDMPLVSPAVLRMLHARWRDTACHIVAPVVGGEEQPMPACYDTRLASNATRLLAEGRRDLRALREALGVRVHRLEEADLVRADPDLRSFRGINTPEEWADVLVRAAGAPSFASGSTHGV